MIKLNFCLIFGFFFIQIIFLCEIKGIFNVNKIFNVYEKYKVIEIYVKILCVMNNYGLNIKKVKYRRNNQIGLYILGICYENV